MDDTSQYDQVINSLSSDELDTLNSDPKLLADFKAKYGTPAATPTTIGQDLKRVGANVWEDFKTPEKMSREGLTEITNGGVNAQNWLANKTGLPFGTEPTGNMARDILANTPRIAGETLTQVAPSFVSRGQIVTGGLLRGAGAIAEAAAPAAKWMGSALEGQSGLDNVPVKTPGLLTEAFQDPTLITKPGTEAAGKLYGDTLADVRPELKYTSNPQEFVAKAMEYANDGTLTSNEALAARQELDGIKNNVSNAFYQNARGVLGYIAKADHSGADEAYVQGIKADALRSPSAINKNGTPSVGRGFAMLLKPWTIPLYSPAAQGVAASAAGAAYKGGQAIANNPQTAMAVPGIVDQILNLMKKKDSNANR